MNRSRVLDWMGKGLPPFSHHLPPLQVLPGGAGAANGSCGLLCQTGKPPGNRREAPPPPRWPVFFFPLPPARDSSQWGHFREHREEDESTRDFFAGIPAPLFGSPGPWRGGGGGKKALPIFKQQPTPVLCHFLPPTPFGLLELVWKQANKPPWGSRSKEAESRDRQACSPPTLTRHQSCCFSVSLS